MPNHVNNPNNSNLVPLTPSAPSTPSPSTVPSAPSTAPSAPSTPSTASPFPHLPFQRLDAYRAARELAVLVHRASIADAELRDQATRASKSAFLNLSEGLPDDRGTVRRKYFLQADGSLHETVAAVDLAAAIGALDDRRAAEILAVAARLRALLRGLMRSSGRAG